MAEYLKKGDLVYLEGKSKTDTWEDSDNKKHYRTYLAVSIMDMVGSKK